MLKRVNLILILGLIFCLVATGSVLAKDITLRYMAWGQPIILESMKESISAFEAQNPGVKVELIVPPTGTNYYGKLDAYIAGRQMPDIVRFNWENIMRYAAAGVLMDLDRFGPDSEDYVDALRVAATYNGKLVGLPWHTDTIGIFYNKTLIDAAGVEVPKTIDEAWTWDELTAAAEKAQAAGAKWGLAVDHKNHFIRSTVYQNNATFYTSDGKSPNVTTPEFKEAIDWILQLHDKGIAPVSGWQLIESPSDMFKTGVVAFLIDGSWKLTHYHDSISSFEFGVTYLFTGDQPAQPFGGSCLSVSTTTQYPQEAYNFAEFMTSKEGATKIARDINFLPVRKSLIAEGIEYPQFTEEMNMFGEGLATIPDILVQEGLHPAFSQTLSVLEDVMNVAIAEKWDTEKTCLQIEKELKEIMARIRY